MRLRIICGVNICSSILLRPQTTERMNVRYLALLAFTVRSMAEARFLLQMVQRKRKHRLRQSRRLRRILLNLLLKR